MDEKPSLIRETIKFEREFNRQFPQWLQENADELRGIKPLLAERLLEKHIDRRVTRGRFWRYLSGIFVCGYNKRTNPEITCAENCMDREICQALGQYTPRQKTL